MESKTSEVSSSLVETMTFVLLPSAPRRVQIFAMLTCTQRSESGCSGLRPAPNEWKDAEPTIRFATEGVTPPRQFYLPPMPLQDRLPLVSLCLIRG